MSPLIGRAILSIIVTNGDCRKSAYHKFDAYALLMTHELATGRHSVVFYFMFVAVVSGGDASSRKA